MELGTPASLLYRNLREQIQRYSNVDLPASRFLDFGCGWGNVSRYFSKDIPSSQMYACDPHQQIIETAMGLNPYIQFAVSQSIPDKIPFEGRFDIAIAISIWTHLSERSSEACLNALHSALNPGGLLLLTIRPPLSQYIAGDKNLAHTTIERDGFWCHANMYPVDGEFTFGETVMNLSYVRSKWKDRFELLDTSIFSPSAGQTLLTLRRK